MHRQLNVKQIQLGGKGGSWCWGEEKQREKERENTNLRFFFLRERVLVTEKIEKGTQRERKIERECVCFGGRKER